MIYKNCIRCGRKLRSDASKELGMGKVCWEKFNEKDDFKQLFVMGESKCEKSKK